MKELLVEVEMTPDGTPRLEAALGRLSSHVPCDFEAVRLHFKHGQSNNNNNDNNSSSHSSLGSQRMSEVVEHVKLALLLATATASCFRSLIITGRPSEALLVVMFEAMKHNAVLQSCTLAFGGTSIRISDQTGVALAEAMKHNAVLQSCRLELRSTSISDQTGVALAEALKHNAVLQSCRLDLGGTSISDQTGATLAEALKHNAVLQSCALELTATSISDQAGVALAEAMKHNAVLQSCTLRLTATSISDQTGVALAEALKHNAVLQSCALELTGNSISDQTGVALSEAIVQANATLTSMRLVPPRLLSQSACRALERNQELPSLWCHVARVARRSASRNLQDIVAAMSEQAFRRAVFEFLLPPGYFESHMRPAAAAEPAQLTAASAAEPMPSPAQDEEPEKPVSSEQSEEVELSLALELSQQEANAEENSHVAEALLRSRSEARLSGDGVVLLRLDSHARSPQVAEALLYSPELAPCRAMVAEAGCELQPAWAGGAWLFVPLTESQFQEAGPDLHANVKHIHILALSEHEPLVHQALKCVPRKCRPKCYHESLGAPAALSVPGASSCGAFEETVSRGDAPPGSSEVGSPASPTLNQDRSSAGRLNGDFAYDIVVQRTFIHFPSPSSDASTERHSAP